jgi:hypothetical protein
LIGEKVPGDLHEDRFLSDAEAIVLIRNEVGYE